MKSLRLILILLLTLTIYSCERVDTESTLRQAESDLQAGKIELAISSCDILADTTSVQPLTSTQMCRVAILYARISELSDNQDYMASATQCFERALALDNATDSLDRYIESLDIESQGLVRVIREVSHSLSSPYDYTEDHDEEGEYCEDEYSDNATASL